MLRRFRLEEPESIEDASDLLARYGDSAKVYAGGTELLLVMKEGLIHYERLVNIKKIRSLDQITATNGFIHIGALSTHRKLVESSLLRERLPALVGMENEIANIRVREVGTLGGNLCFAEPHADPGTLLLVLGAKLFAAKGSSSREIPVERFFVDAYETSLEPDEILSGVQVPLLPPPSGVAYLKFGYLERPSVGVAVRVTLDHARESIVEARVAVGCAGPVPKRVEEAETVLQRISLKEAASSVVKAGEIAGRACQAISDLHGSRDYKEHIVGVLLKRAFQRAQEHCA
jgi:aerobic carbon-monoxide dehydrogenase medium subunit